MLKKHDVWDIPVYKRSKLNESSDDFNYKQILSLFDKRAFNPEELELLVNIYAHALASEISKSFDVNLTPYLHHHASKTPSQDKYLTFELLLLRGNPSLMTKYLGSSILNSTIDTVQRPQKANGEKYFAPQVLANDVSFYGNGNVLPSNITLFDIVKDVSDDFAKHTNLTLENEIKVKNIPNHIIYKSKLPSTK